MTWLWPGAGHLQIAGREVIQESLLADGGFAYVYRGRDARSGEALAIRKALLQDAEAQQAARLEIALLRRLPHHDSIVRFLGAEILEGDAAASRKWQAVSLFELCTGGTLFARVEAVKQQRTAGEGTAQRYCCPCLPEAEVLALLCNASAALGHLHAEGVIHYDVKSENLMLGADGLWKLGDFGSASERSFEFQGAPRKLMLEAEEFVHGRCTPIFRAPELADVLLRWPIGPKVDLFALGCVLFACLTGIHPFPMDSALANIQARYQVPPEAEAYAPVLLRWLKDLLQRHPAERPTAAVLLTQVQTFLSTGTADLDQTPVPVARPMPEVAEASFAVESWVADFSQMPGFEPAEVSVARQQPKDVSPVADIDDVTESEGAAGQAEITQPDRAVAAVAASEAQVSPACNNDTVAAVELDFGDVPAEEAPRSPPHALALRTTAPAEPAEDKTKLTNGRPSRKHWPIPCLCSSTRTRE